MKLRNYVKAGILMAACWWITGHSCLAADPIIIKGRMSVPNVEGLTITLNYCPDYYATTVPTERGVKYSAKVKNGSFEFRIENQTNFAYIQFEYGEWHSFQHSTSWNLLNQHLYLIGADSIISITIDKDQCIFSEKSRLLECQYRMYELAFKDTQNIMEYDDYRSFLNRKKSHYDSLVRRQLKILKEYENTIKPVFAEVLKLDFFADWARQDMKYLSIEHIGLGLTDLLSNDTNNLTYYIKKHTAALQYYLDNYLFKQYDTSHPEIKVLSRSFANFLFDKQFYDIGLGMRSTSSEVWPTFTQMMDKIGESYNGPLKEKILASGFLRYYSRGEAKATEQDIDMALRQMKNDEYKRIVQRIKDTRGYGRTSFNFKLLDSSMKVVTQEMLKGKFVILDFWFTGCGGCAYLNKKMTPVYDHFKNNPNVVFVSISIDKELDFWKKYGLNSGLYTHPGSLNLYTNGLGDDDPVIKYYDVMAYPTLILINKEGRIVSGSPPKPVTPESCERFIELVEQHL